jgi:peptidoglycan/LPS O-acetylase OafA/YrhL
VALGLAWQDGGRPARHLFRTGAEASFGVYLAHPLLLQGIVALLVASGLETRASHLPDVAITAITLLVGVPVIYLTCAAVAAGLRRTPLSLPLTGHQRRRGRAVVAPAAPVPPGGLRCEQQTV